LNIYKEIPRKRYFRIIKFVNFIEKPQNCKTMEKNYKVKPEIPHPLQKIWNDYPEFLEEKQNILLSPVAIEEFIGQLFSMGEFYYYTINFSDSKISRHHPDILKMHGLEKYPEHLSEIIALIHPDDLEFVKEAERMSIEKIKEIGGFANIQELKSSYCFRMKTGNGNYEMFHHQALHTGKDEFGRLVQTVNIHTNIHHITQQNSCTVLVAGIGSRSDFHQMQYKNYRKQLPKTVLTKRETEILTLLATGHSAKQISEILALSYHTITTHRRNILRKTGSRKVSELVKKALEWGYV